MSLQHGPWFDFTQFAFLPFGGVLRNLLDVIPWCWIRSASMAVKRTDQLGFADALMAGRGS
ncbi:MAG: hypothetical protein WCY15_16910, partial [Phenylobacterium sp.]|uniref:hypothetical protein n=1 Tax=Phenylobacterium sp. TaxID=1871053 RepID=UPI003565A8C3